MPAPAPLPRDLGTESFTVASAAALGVSAERLRRSDLSRPFHGVRTARRALDLPGRCRAALSVQHPEAFICGPTAALLYGVPLPRRLEEQDIVHAAVPRPGRAPRGRGIRGHSLDRRLAPVRTLDGIRVSVPERTWTDLAALLDVDQLVIAGDHLARWDLGLSSLAALAEEYERSRGRRGRSLLAEALPLLCDRSQSAGETRLRLLLARAGFSGLSPNHDVSLEGGLLRYRIDLALPEQRVAIEYQGGYHAELTRYRSDQTRRERLRADGWLVIEVNARDLDDPVELVARIRRAIARHLGAVSLPSSLDRSQTVA